MNKVVKFFEKYQEIISYAFFGVLTTVVNLGVFYVLEKRLGIYYQTANFFAWLISVLFAYITNKLFVFKTKTYSNEDSMKELVSFFSARIFSLLVDATILKIGIGMLHIDTLIVKLADNVIVVIINYLVSKVFVFRDRSGNKKSE